jgi:hypothetical protein
LATDVMANLDVLIARVRGEYCEMPGLQLTVTQACRLWQVDTRTCEMLLEQLVHEEFLCKTAKGAYAAAATTRRRLYAAGGRTGRDTGGCAPRTQYMLLSLEGTQRRSCRARRNNVHVDLPLCSARPPKKH